MRVCVVGIAVCVIVTRVADLSVSVCVGTLRDEAAQPQAQIAACAFYLPLDGPRSGSGFAWRTTPISLCHQETKMRAPDSMHGVCLLRLLHVVPRCECDCTRFLRHPPSSRLFHLLRKV